MPPAVDSALVARRRPTSDCSNVMTVTMTFVRRSWKSRWLPAGLVALVLAAWPACNRNATAPHAETVNFDFVLKDASTGADVRLADFKGRPLVVNMWATWCGPCKAEIPWFVEFAEKYKAQGFTIVGISVDDVPEDIQAFAKEYKVNYPMLVGKDRPDVSKAFEAELVLPVSWFIKRDGTVHAKVEGIHGKEWFDSTIQELF